MNSYETLILQSLEGETPKEKYDNLILLQKKISSMEIELSMVELKAKCALGALNIQGWQKYAEVYQESLKRVSQSITKL